MNPRHLLLGGILMVCLVLATAVWCRALVGAADAARDGAIERLRQVRIQATAVAGLRQRHEAVTTTRRPDTDLIATLRSAARAAGVPESAFQGVTPRDDRIIGDGSLRIQQVQVQVQGVSLAQVGSWLAALRAAGSPWRIGGLDLIHERRGTGPAADAADRYAVSVLLTAPYLGAGTARPGLRSAASSPASHP
jgi:hypothetical protein